MSRKINPALRNVSLIMDETHWIALTSLAAKKNVVIDTLVGAVLEMFLIKVGELVIEERDNPLKVEVQLEPVRDDPDFYEALLEEREIKIRDQEIAESITDEDRFGFDWHGVK